MSGSEYSTPTSPFSSVVLGLSISTDVAAARAMGKLSAEWAEDQPMEEVNLRLCWSQDPHYHVFGGHFLFI